MAILVRMVRGVKGDKGDEGPKGYTLHLKRRHLYLHLASRHLSSLHREALEVPEGHQAVHVGL